jgi:hypothetical protein
MSGCVIAKKLYSDRFNREVVGKVLDAKDRLKRAGVRAAERLRLLPAGSLRQAQGEWSCCGSGLCKNDHS